MQVKLVTIGQITGLLFVFLFVFSYRELLAEKFEPVRDELFPPSGNIFPGPFEGEVPLSNPPDGATADQQQPALDTTVKEKVGDEAIGANEDAPKEPFDDAVGNTDAGSQSPAAKILGEERLGQVVRAIFNPKDSTFQRLECPQPKGLARYEPLKTTTAGTHSSPEAVKFFFALDLTQCVDLLPRLLGSVVETVRFLGPENCAISIVEGNSDDGTPEVLDAIAHEVEALGTEYFFQTSNIDPKAEARIVSLAQLRNLALQPMLDDTRRYTSPNTTVVFLNDVAICMEDILELVYQRSLLGADMTCAMDWTYVGANPTFYDVWISRTITGESFFNIPGDRSWDFAWNLFWNDPETQSRYNSHLPFQVFSCWNGAVAFAAEPIVNKVVTFRSSNEGECFQGEPELLCKDFWFAGYGKIAVVPSVNLEYTDDRGKDIKALKGYTSKWVGPKQDEKSRIDWQLQPPDHVKCMEVLEMSDWRPWNETLKR